MTEPNDDKVQCYGTRIECPRRSDCDLGGPCLSRARESSDDLHYQYQHVSVPQMEYAPGKDVDLESNQTAKAYYEAVEETASSNPLNLEGITIPPEALPSV